MNIFTALRNRFTKSTRGKEALKGAEEVVRIIPSLHKIQEASDKTARMQHVIATERNQLLQTYTQVENIKIDTDPKKDQIKLTFRVSK